MTVKLSVFKSDPHFLLVYMPDEGALVLPVLKSPFKVEEVKAASAGTLFKVKEDVLGGVLRGVIYRRQKEEGDARRCQALRDASYQASILKGSDNTLVASHAAAIAKKLEVDEELRQAKIKYLEVCCARSTRGITIDPNKFNKLVQRIENLKQESQALQCRIGELKQQQKQENTVRSQDVFRAAAKKVLPPELFNQVLAEACKEG